MNNEKWLKLKTYQNEILEQSRKEVNGSDNDKNFLMEKLNKEKALFRIIENLDVYLIVNDICYITYTGKEEDKEIFNKYFTNYKMFIDALIKKFLKVSFIKTDKSLNKERVDWLEILINKIEPKNISLNIMKN